MSFIVEEVKVSQMTSTTKGKVTCKTMDDVGDYIRSQAYTMDKEKHFIVVHVNEHKAAKGE